MNLHAILGEVRRDLATGTARCLLVAAILIAVVGTVALADAGAVASVFEDSRRFQDSGAAVQVVESAAVDGDRCESITGSPGVRSAGAIRDGDPMVALALPGQTLPVLEVTPGLLDVVTAVAPVDPRSDRHAPGVWASSDIAARLALTPGAVLDTTTGPVQVTGVFTWPEDGRLRTLGHTLLAPVPVTGTFTLCAAQVWPTDDDAVALLMFTADGDRDPDRPTRVTQLNTTLGTRFDYGSRLAARPTGWAPIAAAAGGLLVGVAITRARRLEIASALHARIPRASLAWIHVLQGLVLGAVAAVVVSAIVLASARATGLAAWPTIWHTGLRVTAVGALTLPLGSLAAVLITRESRLFRFFKAR